MRTILISLTLAVAACGGTAPFEPQPAHEFTNADDEFAQCQTQENGGNPVSLPDGGVYFPATYLDGAVAAGYLTKEQCQDTFTKFDAGTYTGP